MMYIGALITCALIVLKLLGMITIGWFWTLLPFLVCVTFVAVAFAFTFAVIIIGLIIAAFVDKG